MRNILYQLGIIFGALLLFSCNMRKDTENEQSSVMFKGQDGEIRLMILDPGHFHASLLQKFPQRQVNDTVFVYAPEGDELDQYLASIENYNQRPENPTNWQIKLYSGEDYLEKMIEEKNGNVVVLAGNNKNKTDYIFQSINAGFNVLSDKPMVINKDKFEQLKQAYDIAQAKQVYLYDIMTERYDIFNTITRELLKNKELFGELLPGKITEPSVVLESVHHFFKEVSGNTVIRPEWFYDIEQQGEAIVDVATHLVDLVNWICFPDEIIDYQRDCGIISSSHWPTRLTLAEFAKSTQKHSFPSSLEKYVHNSVLDVFSNGDIYYRIKDKIVKITALWNNHSPDGSGDTYNASFHGTKAIVRIIQNKSTGYVEEMFVEKNSEIDVSVFEDVLDEIIAKIQEEYHYISIQKVTPGKYQFIVPIELRKGHEDYFGFVAQKFFNFLIDHNMPEWEIKNTLTKYYITTSALEIAKEYKYVNE